MDFDKELPSTLREMHILYKEQDRTGESQSLTLVSLHPKPLHLNSSHLPENQLLLFTPFTFP